MTLQIITCEQGTPEWFAARLGIPTASEFETILTTPKSKGGESKMRRTYLNKLAGELLTGNPMEAVTTFHMERGKIMEDEARDYYAFLKNVEPERVGFMRNCDKGCSPDSLIGDSGMLEIKTALAHLMVDQLRKNEFPAEHKAQCQGQLWVAEREWVDLVVYWPKLPPFVQRAYRDEGYIANLAGAVDAFNAELQEVVASIRAYGKEAIAA